MQPFEVLGNTVTFTGAGTPPSAVQANSFNGVRTTQVLLTNIGTDTVFVGWGSTAGEAEANALVPAGASKCYPLLGGTQVVITAPSGQYWSGDTSSGTSIVYVCCGIGE